MIQTRKYGQFPLVEDVTITLEKSEIDKEVDADLGGLNLQQEFKLPNLFFEPPNESLRAKEIKGYRFYVPNIYEQNKEREGEMFSRANENNIITFQIKDPVPIDFLDKMTEKDTDLRIVCENIADDFLKNMAAS